MQVAKSSLNLWCKKGGWIEFESARKLLMNLNSTFAKSMNLNLNFDFSKSMNLNLVFSQSMNLNLIFSKSMNLNLKIKKKMNGSNPANHYAIKASNSKCQSAVFKSNQCEKRNLIGCRCTSDLMSETGTVQ